MKKGEFRINKEDIIGKRVGMLTVIGYARCKYSSVNGKGKVSMRPRHYYTVKCDCGTVKEINRSQILNEITHSCGCTRRKK